MVDMLALLTSLFTPDVQSVFRFKPTAAIITSQWPTTQQLSLSTNRPEHLKGSFGEDVKYAYLKLGPVSEQRRYLIVLQPAAGDRPARMWVDLEGDGVPREVKLARSKYATEKGELGMMFRADVTVRSTLKRQVFPVEFQISDLLPINPNDSERLNAIAHVCFSGSVHLGKQDYKAATVDLSSTGDFTVPSDPKVRAPLLLLDVNKDGRFAIKGEQFDTRKPFAIAGETYMATISADGSSVEVRKSAEKAAEVAPPPSFRRGSLLTPFEVQTRDGKTIRFPQDFRGRRVLINVWAPVVNISAEALPTIKKLSDAYAPNGLAVLNLAMVLPHQMDDLKEAEKDLRADWPEAVLEKGWQAPVISDWELEDVPFRVLVDGNSGRVLAENSELSNPKVVPTIERIFNKPAPAELKNQKEATFDKSIKNPALLKQLQELVIEDQRVRELSDIGNAPISLIGRWTATDHKDTAFMKAVLKRFGWPGYSLVGKDGSHNAWLMIQHADDDPAFQVQALTAMKLAVDQKEANSKEYAYLTDRVLTNTGKKQRYGTQLSTAGGKIATLPVEDPDHIDERRKSMGMSTIKEYLDSSSKRFGMPLADNPVRG